MQIRTPLVLASALVLAAGSAGAQAVQARDSSYIRGDRTIYHQHAPSETEWGYAQAIVVGNTIYVSGTVSGGRTLDEEITNIYRRIERTLRVNGFTMQDVVKETAYAKDIQALAAANPARLRAYAGHTPAATWVQITRLLADGANVEIEVTAVRTERPR
ncbi:MAG: hypothetical protein C0503_08140 [Gemmatimonas sp.]|nr:hypothetical protein [Gemmatimonas sp.]